MKIGQRANAKDSQGGGMCCWTWVLIYSNRYLKYRIKDDIFCEKVHDIRITKH